MNTLSLLIYFAEVFDKLSTATSFLSFVTFFAAILTMCLYLSCRQDRKRAADKLTNYSDDSRYYESYKADYETEVQATKESISFSKIAVTAFVISVLSYIFVPGSQTIYMIAASEMGEQVVKSPEAIEIFETLKDRLLHEINEYKQED